MLVGERAGRLGALPFLFSARPPKTRLTQPRPTEDGQPYLEETEYRVLHRVLNRLHLVPHHQTANRQPLSP